MRPAARANFFASEGGPVAGGGGRELLAGERAADRLHLRLVCDILYKKNRKRTVLSRRAFGMRFKALYEKSFFFY